MLTIFQLKRTDKNSSVIRSWLDRLRKWRYEYLHFSLYHTLQIFKLQYSDSTN